jgi:hypothetical protein
LLCDLRQLILYARGHGLWDLRGLGKKALKAVERDDYLRALEFASPSFLESILKAYRMAEQGATAPTGKALTDEQGKPIRLSGGEAAARP